MKQAAGLAFAAWLALPAALHAGEPDGQSVIRAAAGSSA